MSKKRLYPKEFPRGLALRVEEELYWDLKKYNIKAGEIRTILKEAVAKLEKGEKHD